MVSFPFERCDGLPLETSVEAVNGVAFLKATVDISSCAFLLHSLAPLAVLVDGEWGVCIVA